MSCRRSVVPAVVRAKTDHQKTYRYGALVDAKGKYLPVSKWTPANIDAALEVLPEQLDLKKRVVFQAVRVAECGNMVSPPLGESMALLGKDIALARLERALKIAQ